MCELSTAYHEAGHAVANWWYRIRIEKATIIGGEGYAGFVKGKLAVDEIDLSAERAIGSMDGSDRARTRMEKDVIALLAGPATQRRFFPRGWRHHHGKSDLRNAIGLIECFAPDNELKTYLKLLQIRAKNFVQRRYILPLIEAVAKELLIHRTLTGKQIIAIIKQTNAN